MDYRRRQGVQMSWTSKEDGDGTAYHYDYASSSLPSSSASSIAAKAIRESSAFRDSSLSAAYGQHYSLSGPRDNRPVRFSRQDSTTHEYTPLKNLNESNQRFWGLLARKAKAILDDDNVAQSHETSATGRRRYQIPREAIGGQYYTSSSLESCQKTDSPTFQKGLDAIASSLNYIGSTIGNAFEEGFTMAENRTIEIIQETCMRRQGGSEIHNQPPNANTRRPHLMQNRVQPHIQTDLETQLKASRDVAMAMAAKAKVLLRELKTVKADLMFAKNRCSQLEEENRVLRESHGNGDNPDDDDLIRLQLETLLSEKARLAQENSVFARENRFLREIVEYHQLTMQDVVYLDENSEEVTEVYPIKVSTTSNLSSVASPDNPLSAPSPFVSHPIY